MKMMSKVLIIESYLDELIPNPVCELEFNKDYELLIATMLSAQSTDKRVNKVTRVLFSKFPTLDDLRCADLNDLENIIRSVGSFRKKSVYIKGIVNRLKEYDDVLPDSVDALKSFPGVGRKTANVVLSVIYNYPAIAVDTHVERVSKRLGLAKDSASVLEVENSLMKKFKKSSWSLRHHQMVLFGRYYCKAKKPLCSECKLLNICKKKD